MAEEQHEMPDLRAPNNPHSHIKKVIGIISGKGGVGKSLTTSILAAKAAKEGKKVAIIDADITGPSIPTIFGLKGMVTGTEEAIVPMETRSGIKVISLNLLTDDPAEPVIWRGPVISGLIKQFWTNVEWGEIDELYVDMPPGTGDVPLTVFQSLPVDAVICVATPQDLVSLIVEKAVRMASMMNIPLVGLVMNMAYMVCPHCNEKVYPFGEGKVEALANHFGIPFVGELPIDPSLAEACDLGKIEDLPLNYLDEIYDCIDRIKAKK